MQLFGQVGAALLPYVEDGDSGPSLRQEGGYSPANTRPASRDDRDSVLETHTVLLLRDLCRLDGLSGLRDGVGLEGLVQGLEGSVFILRIDKA